MITDGKMECVPKKEIMECFLKKLFFILAEEDGIMLGGQLRDDTGHYHE